MKNDPLFKQLDKYNKKRVLELYRRIKLELKDIPQEKNRDEVIAFNLAMLFTWGDIQV